MAARDVSAHSVPGEKSDDQAETSRTNGERNASLCMTASKCLAAATFVAPVERQAVGQETVSAAFL